MNRRFALNALLVFFVLYGGTAFFARGLVDSMLYHPQAGSQRESANAVRFKTEEGTELCAAYWPNPQARITIWYFHGNAEDLGDIEPRLKEFHARGYAVFACDYPGYGLSKGTPTEKSLYAANAAAQKYLTGTLKVPIERVVVYGRSLGSGSATEIASHEKVAGLVLESPFTSVYRVMTRWPLLPGDQFKNANKISKVQCPVFIMHGRDDRVIPFHHGETLFKLAPEPKQHFWVDFAGHNNVEQTAGVEYWNRLQQFLNAL